MSLETTPNTLILYIWQFLETNNESISFLKVCKYLKYIGNKHGYIRNITLDYSTNIHDFLHTCSKHYKSITDINISGFDQPQHWITFKYPRKVILNNCDFDEKDVYPQEESTITELIITGSSNSLKNINIDKLPRLKRLCINSTEYDIDNIKKLKKLKK